MQQNIVELRQYTLRPGRRDALIDLFDGHFIEPQKSAGISLIGQFRDVDDPDRFVWLRGFPDMDVRASALQAFYGGPVWKAHRDAANATMADSDNVLLLRPVSGVSMFADNLRASKFYAVDILYLREYSSDFADIFESRILPMLRAHASIVAYFVTCAHPNNFPALPIRENENVLVWFTAFADRDSYDRYGAWLDDADFRPETDRYVRETERHLLAPTSGSYVQ
jgi:NIPSNAP